MSATPSSSQEVPYGVARVCRVWEIASSTFYDWRRRVSLPPDDRPAPLKRGPKTEHSDDELAELIRGVLDDVEREAGFRGEGHRKVHARLRFAGVRAGKERVLRIMREQGLLAPVRQGRLRGPQAHEGTITTEEPDRMWGTDATSTLTLEEGHAWVFAVVDHCTGECLGLHAAKNGTRFEALEPVHQAVRRSFGALDEGAADGLMLRHDHGSQYTSELFQNEIRFLGMESSPSFVASPEGNGVVERFFRTLKEQLMWVRYFRTVEDLRLALDDFRKRYNERWILARHGYRTPAQVRADLSTSAAA